MSKVEGPRMPPPPAVPVGIGGIVVGGVRKVREGKGIGERSG